MGLNPSSERASKRRAFTFFEVLLVLAIIVLTTGVTWPLLAKPLAYARLRRSCDLVMAEWSTARVEAMRTGDHQIFQYNQGTGAYKFSSGAGGNLPSSELPEDIVFAGGMKEEDAREMSEGGAGDPQAAEIWFYPDGTSSDVPELLLKNEYGMQIRLVLRGLTGIAIVEENAPDDADANQPPGAKR